MILSKNLIDGLETSTPKSDPQILLNRPLFKAGQFARFFDYEKAKFRKKNEF